MGISRESMQGLRPLLTGNDKQRGAALRLINRAAYEDVSKPRMTQAIDRLVATQGMKTGQVDHHEADDLIEAWDQMQGRRKTSSLANWSSKEEASADQPVEPPNPYS